MSHVTIEAQTFICEFPHPSLTLRFFGMTSVVDASPGPASDRVASPGHASDIPNRSSVDHPLPDGPKQWWQRRCERQAAEKKTSEQRQDQQQEQQQEERVVAGIVGMRYRTGRAKPCKYLPECPFGCTEDSTLCHHYFRTRNCRHGNECKYLHR